MPLPAATPPVIDYCNIDQQQFDVILGEVKKQNPNAIKVLPDCLKMNRKLMLQAAIADSTQFQYASDSLKKDSTFVRRVAKIRPEVLQYAAINLLQDPNFIEESIYTSRDAIKYADAKLRDDILFMRKMIALDSSNYQFASERIKNMAEFIEMTLKDNGMMLAYTPDVIKNDRKYVRMAVESNINAFQYAGNRFKNDVEFLGFTTKSSSIKSEDELKKFLQQNYLKQPEEKHLTVKIFNKAKLFATNKIIDRKYISKWYKTNNTLAENQIDDMMLIPADSRNYSTYWKDDFKKFPHLADKIENFFLNRHVDKNTISNLYTTYLWNVKSNPNTVAFNLYLLRDSNDSELGRAGFANITSLSAIAQYDGSNWQLSVIEVIFDKEIKLDISYPQGHKKFEMWDLYVTDKNDKNPKIIFRVDDRFEEYFEVYEEVGGGKYRSRVKVRN